VKPVTIEEEAERELSGSVEFYERRRAGLGLEFEYATRQAVRTIQADPERHPLQKDGTRRYVMKRFPFIIRYVDLPDTIWIIAFAHTSRKPGYWRARLQSKP
jgi:toxin ParE1/3/4